MVKMIIQDILSISDCTELNVMTIGEQLWGKIWKEALVA